MRQRKPNVPPATRPTPVPATAATPAGRPASRARRSWAAIVALVALLGLAWGAWSLWGPDPLAEVRAALDRREFRTADELLAKRLTDSPDDADARLLAARSARRGGNLVAASDHLRKYKERHGATDALERETRLLRAAGDAAEAGRLLAEYQSRPDARDSHLLLETYIEGRLRAGPTGAADDGALEAFAASEAELHRAIDVWLSLRPGRPDQVQGWMWRARAFLAANKHGRGIAALREAVDLAPDSLDARFQLAVNQCMTAPDEARRHLEVLMVGHAENPFVRLGLANTYRMLGRAADARRLYEGLLADRLRIDALVELGTLDMDEGKLADAERRLWEALGEAPNAPGTNVAMSRLHQLAGRPAEAEKYRKRFEELDAARKQPRPK